MENGSMLIHKKQIFYNPLYGNYAVVMFCSLLTAGVAHKAFENDVDALSQWVYSYCVNTSWQNGPLGQYTIPHKPVKDNSCKAVGRKDHGA